MDSVILMDNGGSMNKVIVEHVKKKQTLRNWTCGSCGTLLGIIYRDGTLAVKYKDLVAWVTGNYKTICRKCKVVNEYNTNSLDSIDCSNL